MRVTSTLVAIALFVAACSTTAPPPRTATVARADASATPAVPRYSLPVGRTLTWSLSTVTTNQPPATNEQERTTGTLRAVVTRQNTDGSRRVVIRSAMTLEETPRGEKPKVRPEYVRLSYIDVFSDGRILPNPMVLSLSYPTVLFPLLPASNEQLTRGWVRQNEAMLERLTYASQPVQRDRHQFVFTGVDEGIEIEMYGTALSYTFQFDTRRGVLTSVESRRLQSYGYDMTSTTRIELQGDEPLRPDQVATLAADYDRLFDTQRAYGSRLSLAEEDPADAEVHLANAEAIVRRAAASAETAVVKTELETILAQHAQAAKYIKDRAEELEQVVGKPAPDWETTDIRGNAMRSTDLKGKVVVLDFWYRMCGPCLLAMPHVRRLAEDYQDRVVVLGMNTDENPEDARLVVERFKLNYPTLRAKHLAKKFGVIAFPSLFVIDQHGIVRHVHVGYSATLRADVGKEIDQLLAAGR